MTNPFFIRWLPAAIVITIIFGTMYGAIQQEIRQDANDPQIASAEDASAAIHSGYPPAELLQGVPKSDMQASLEPFMMFFDASGQILGSSATFGLSTSTPPVPPVGVFQYVAMHGEDRFTWQVASGERYAAVVVPWAQASSTMVAADPDNPTSGFLLVARSLREVETRESHVGFIVFIGWLLSIIASVAGALWFGRKAL